MQREIEKPHGRYPSWSLIINDLHGNGRIARILIAARQISVQGAETDIDAVAYNLVGENDSSPRPDPIVLEKCLAGLILQMERLVSHELGQGQKIRFRRIRNWLLVDLPSGRHLSYFKPRIGLNKFGTETVNFVDPKTNIRVDVYGGVFAENVTQALARDLLCNAIHLLADAGYATTAHIHDEVVVEISDGKDLDKVSELMATNPPWAKGLPLAAAGYVCTSYRKD